MRYPTKILLFVAALTTGLLAQGALVTAKNPSATEVMGERDKEKEDQVAKLFENIRTEARVPQLKRIRHRDDLEEDICTSVLTGRPSEQKSGRYVIADPGTVTPELKKIASSNRLDPKGRPFYERYSTAVWRAKDPQTGEVAYWVGVGLYSSAVAEFVDCHFTDDVHYCGKWKESIARVCRGK